MPPLPPPADLKEIGAGVYQTTHAVSFLSAEHIAWLKQAAAASDKKRARICLHQSPDDLVHEMVIAVHKDSFIAPHYHPHKEESLQVIDGVCEVLIFSDAGKLENIRTLEGNTRPAQSYAYRIARNIVHGLRLKSDFLVFHEVAAGPLRPDANQIPAFMPAFKTDRDGIDWLAGLKL